MQAIQNYRFEKAAQGRKTLAILLAILFHLALLAGILFSDQASSDLANSKTEKEVSTQPTKKPIP